MTKIPVDPKGRVTLPHDVCEKLGIKPGDVLEVEVEDDRLVIRRGKKRPFSEFRGIFHVPGIEFKGWSEEREIAWASQLHGYERAVLEGADPDEYINTEPDEWKR